MMFILWLFFFFFIVTPTTAIYTLSLHDALPIYLHIPEMLRPRFLIHGCNHRLVIRQHLPQAVAIDNFDVGTGGRVFRESTTYLERVYDATVLSLDAIPLPEFRPDLAPPRPAVASV